MPAARPTITLVVTNSGTADLAGVKFTASPPRDWTVTFAPERSTSPAGRNGQRCSHDPGVQQALAGDYVISITARPADGARPAALPARDRRHVAHRLSHRHRHADHRRHRPVLRLPALWPSLRSGPSRPSSGRHATGACDPRQGPDQEVRRFHRRRQARSDGRPRRDLRPAGTQRRRQDDDDPDAARPFRAHRAGTARVLD